MTVEKFMSKNNDLNYKRIAEFVITLSSDLKEGDDYVVENITGSVSYSYIGDFYGLLKQEFKLPESVFFIHLLINGYYHPTDYNGEKQIKILKPEVAKKIIDLIEEKEY